MVEPAAPSQYICPTCKAKGFAPSLIKGRCHFCDGTENNEGPTPDEWCSVRRWFRLDRAAKWTTPPTSVTIYLRSVNWMAGEFPSFRITPYHLHYFADYIRLIDRALPPDYSQLHLQILEYTARLQEREDFFRVNIR